MAAAKDETTEEVTTDVEQQNADEQAKVQEAVEGAQDEALNGRQLDAANDPVLGEGESVDPLEQGKSDSAANHQSHLNDQA